jgi:RNA polymerase sigma factor (sigma-70 family)
MAQGNVISTPWRYPLHQLIFPISLSPTTAPAAAEPRIRYTMKSAAGIRTESDAHRSALMAAAQKGDRVAYEKLLRDCASLSTSLARRRGVPPDRVDDVVQEVLLTVHRSRATYDPRRCFEAWLRIIVERRAIDALRQMRRHGRREVHAPVAYESYADETSDHSVRIEHKDKAKQIGAALTELPQRQREAVRHLMVDGRSLADAAVLSVDGAQQRIAQGELASGAERAASRHGLRATELVDLHWHVRRVKKGTPSSHSNPRRRTRGAAVTTARPGAYPSCSPRSAARHFTTAGFVRMLERTGARPRRVTASLESHSHRADVLMASSSPRRQVISCASITADSSRNSKSP